jgi:hypothetical protein
MPLLLSEPNIIHEQQGLHHPPTQSKITNTKSKSKLMPLYMSGSPSERHHSANAGRHVDSPLTQSLNLTNSSNNQNNNIPVVMKTGTSSHLNTSTNNHGSALFRLNHPSSATSHTNAGAINSNHYNNGGKLHNGSMTNNSNSNNVARFSMNLPSKSSLLSSNSSNNPTRTLSNSSNSGSNSSSEKKKRSDSVSSLLPFKENIQLNNSSSFNSLNAHGNSPSTMNGSGNGRGKGSTSSNGKASPAPPAVPKRQKSNSLSIMDYCNIMSTNTNYQIMANFTNLSDDVFESTGADFSASNSGSSSNNTSSLNYQKQGSLSEQMAAMFGFNECTCFLCVNNANRKSPNQINYEIVANRHNSDFSIMKYTYSAPLSQLSALKLFNMFNCDCSISLKTDNRSNSSSGDHSN